MRLTCLFILFVLNSILRAQFSFPLERKEDTIYYGGENVIVKEDKEVAIEKNYYYKTISIHSIFQPYGFRTEIEKLRFTSNSFLKKYEKYTPSLYEGNSGHLLQISFVSKHSFKNVDFKPVVDHLLQFQDSLLGYPSFTMDLYEGLWEDKPSFQDDSLFEKETQQIFEILLKHRNDTCYGINGILFKVKTDGSIDTAFLGESTLAKVSRWLVDENFRFPVLIINEKTSEYVYYLYGANEKARIHLFEIEHQKESPYVRTLFEETDSIYIYQDLLTRESYLISFSGTKGYVNNLSFDYGWIDSLLDTKTCLSDLDGDGRLDFVFEEKRNPGYRYYYILNSPFQWPYDQKLEVDTLLPGGYYVQSYCLRGGEKCVRLYKVRSHKQLLGAEFNPAYKENYSNPYVVPIDKGVFKCINNIDFKNKHYNYWGNNLSRGKRTYKAILERIRYYIEHPNELPN